MFGWPWPLGALITATNTSFMRDLNTPWAKGPAIFLFLLCLLSLLLAFSPINVVSVCSFAGGIMIVMFRAEHGVLGTPTGVRAQHRPSMLAC